MRLSVAVLSCVCAVGVAWAADPQPPATVAPSSTAPASTTTDAANKTSTAHTNAADTTVLVTAEKERKWRSQGYKPEKRKDETFWCRRESTIGSRFEEKKCWTAEALEENERNSQKYVEDLQHSSNPNGK